MSDLIPLCDSLDLVDGDLAVPFDVIYSGQSCFAFAIRFHGESYAYLNRCSHIPMEMDYQPNRFFDSTGEWLICSTHGALYNPRTGDCQGGPCRGGLIPISLEEKEGVVYWHTQHNLKPNEF
jgi:nitrite reductase/ring-hydroxylating ferredoxin subunit|tara:strand:+ start:227 stop:592 length:366 start_codon:yes stop_codon:yes gene_type:complete